jgi:hypothetical protein
MIEVEMADIPSRYAYRYKVMHDLYGWCGDWKINFLLYAMKDESFIDAIHGWWKIYTSSTSPFDTLTDLQIKSGRWYRCHPRAKKRRIRRGL